MRQAQDSTPVLWLQTQSAVSSIQHCFPRESAVGSNRTWWPDRGSNGVGMGRISFFGKSLNPRDNSGIYHTGLLWWWNESQSAIAIIATTTTTTRHLLSPCYKPDNSEHFVIQLIITTTLYDRSHYSVVVIIITDFWIDGSLTTHNNFALLPKIIHKGLNTQRWGEKEKQQ